MQKTYKICVIGGGETGKTTFVRKLLSGEYTKEYIPTLGCEVHPIKIKGDNNKWMSFNVWDCSGKEEFRGLVDGYYILSDGFIVFASTEEQTIEFLDEIPKDVPTVLVLPKIDEKKEYPKWVETLAKNRNIPFIDISTKENMNLEKPFYILAQNQK